MKSTDLTANACAAVIAYDDSRHAFEHLRAPGACVPTVVCVCARTRVVVCLCVHARESARLGVEA